MSFRSMQIEKKAKPDPKGVINWKLKDNKIIHHTHGIVDLSQLISTPLYEIIAVVPLNPDYCFFLVLTKIKEMNYVQLKDLRLHKNKASSIASFNFFIDVKKVRKLKNELKSCSRSEGTLGVGFFLRRLSALGINNFVSSEFIRNNMKKKY